jgi:hypothetical protein
MFFLETHGSKLIASFAETAFDQSESVPVRIPSTNFPQNPRVSAVLSNMTINKRLEKKVQD